MMTEEKEFEDYTKKQQELIKEIVIARIKQMPDNLRLSIG